MRRLSLHAAVLLGLAAVAFGAAAQPPYVPRTPTVSGCVVTTASAICVAGSFTAELTVENTSATASVACAFNTTAALNSPTSFMLLAGEVKSWSFTQGSPPPVGPLHCIGSATGAVRAEFS